MEQWILTDVVFSLWVMRVHKLQQANFNLCLVQERLFVFDDFYGDVFFFLMIVSFANLEKKNKCRVNRVVFWLQLLNICCKGPSKKRTLHCKKFLRLRAPITRASSIWCCKILSPRSKNVSEFVFRTNIRKRCFTLVLLLSQQMSRKMRGEYWLTE